MACPFLLPRALALPSRLNWRLALCKKNGSKSPVQPPIPCAIAGCITIAVSTMDPVLCVPRVWLSLLYRILTVWLFFSVPKHVWFWSDAGYAVMFVSVVVVSVAQAVVFV
jgi:hypothetical protein